MDTQLLSDILKTYLKIRKELKMIKKDIFKIKKRRERRFPPSKRYTSEELEEVEVKRDIPMKIKNKNTNENLNKTFNQIIPNRTQKISSKKQTIHEKKLKKSNDTDSLGQTPIKKTKTQRSISNNFDQKIEDDLNFLGL